MQFDLVTQSSLWLLQPFSNDTSLIDSDESDVCLVFIKIVELFCLNDLVETEDNLEPMVRASNVDKNAKISNKYIFGLNLLGLTLSIESLYKSTIKNNFVKQTKIFLLINKSFCSLILIFFLNKLESRKDASREKRVFDLQFGMNISNCNLSQLATNINLDLAISLSLVIR
ncbi:hypothetical protein BpHYR1_019767 [Brachionus plicatilis]|uniref:Uncharacterized protein n=1 Tax=Brachionus plicatilis TaxID=10195 RepID=A0A3M7PPL1_BRAPC|nr:hypothetical protein BpHYR1_019767 [Brachionus plicatilis]